MEIYAGLFESMSDCCGRVGLRAGPIYTLTMMALALGISLNLLSVIDLLWAFGILDNPYRMDGDLHLQHYLFGLLYGAFLANTVLARIKFSADRRVSRPAPQLRMHLAQLAASRIAAPVYLTGSAGFFLLTLIIGIARAS